jgi:hypothetical protein
MKQLIVCIILMLTASCSMVDSAPSDRLRLPIMYGTMKAIENSENVTGNGVLAYVGTARTLIEQDVTITAKDLARELIALLLTEDLSPADRFLVNELVNTIAGEVDRFNFRTPDEAVGLLTVLDWIEVAAIMAEGRS